MTEFILAEERLRLARKVQAPWAKLPVRERCRVLKKLRHLIAAEVDELVEIISADTGKPALDALSGDLMVTLEQMRYYEASAPRLLSTRKIDKPAILYSGACFEERREPHGVALVFAPYNYPFQLSLLPALTALYAGNAVVLKCSERTPRTARAIATLCERAGLPEGLMQVVADRPEDASALIDARPDVIFFTGSTVNGRSIAARAAQYLIPITLELGGKDAAIVFSDCDFDRTVEGILYGAFANAGQVCVNTKRLYVENRVYDRMLDALTSRAKTLRSGTGRDADIGSLIGNDQKIRLDAQVEEALQAGAVRLTAETDDVIILSDVPQNARLLTEDCFGPVLCIAPFRDVSEAIKGANSSRQSLTCSIWTKDIRRAEQIANLLHAANISINDVIRNIGNPYASFGGNNDSGYGRYRGPQGLYTFSRTKTVMTLQETKPREIHWFPFTAKTYAALHKLISFRHRNQGLMQRLRHLLPAAFILLATPVLYSESPPAAHLFINVQLPAAAHGELGYLIFSSKTGFPDTPSKALKGGFVAVRGGATAMMIDAGLLPPASYAVTVYEDTNGNRKLDKSLIGIPKEPVGASNNPAPRMGPPRFGDCVFALKGSRQTISVKLVDTGA
ncbi:aldehyde dehydrogenase family protein [Silvibacterium acidisoli]|uniref:aldehyde dehydrogenase family protein n=1 Tax=Acidobacteriaceae bacterium ZG23-2 TaxID=2883246 RepID=UPI00406CE91E